MNILTFHQTAVESHDLQKEIQSLDELCQGGVKVKTYMWGDRVRTFLQQYTNPSAISSIHHVPGATVIHEVTKTSRESIITSEDQLPERLLEQFRECYGIRQAYSRVNGYVVPGEMREK